MNMSSSWPPPTLRGLLLPTLAALFVASPLVPGLAVAQLDEGLAAMTRQDFEAARRAFRTAAEAGDARAQYNLGVMHERGLGVTADAGRAADWYVRAAEQGLVQAQHNLGALYLKGEGVERNGIEAARWFGYAAEQGSLAAQINLAEIYLNGLDVGRDPVEAVTWFEIVRRRLEAWGDATPEELRSNISERLESIREEVSEEALTRGEEAAEVWIAEHPDAMRSPQDR